MSVWSRITGDVEVKKQLVTACVVASLVTVYESLLFFGVVMPRGYSSLQTILHRKNAVLPDDPTQQEALRTMLATADVLEDRFIKENHTNSVLVASILAVLPLLIVMFIFATSSKFRKESKVDMYIDIVLVASGILVFQGAFFMLGLQWGYPGENEMVVDVADVYRAGANGPLATDCDGCIQVLRERLKDSPTAKRLMQDMDNPDVRERYVRDAMQSMGLPISDAPDTPILSNPLSGTAIPSNPLSGTAIPSNPLSGTPALSNPVSGNPGPMSGTSGPIYNGPVVSRNPFPLSGGSGALSLNSGLL